MFKGIIIEESLTDTDVLDLVNIVSTKVEQVTEKHKTPWLKQWTLHKVEIPEDKVEQVAKLISRAIDTTHQSWYADFKSKTHHYSIFPSKIFLVDRLKKSDYQQATDYGIKMGIPDHHLDFSEEIVG